MELHVNRYASWEPGPQMGVRDRALGRRAPGSCQSLGDRVGGGGEKHFIRQSSVSLDFGITNTASWNPTTGYLLRDVQ